MNKKELQTQYDCIVHNNTDRDGFDSLTAFEEIYSLFTAVRDSQSLQTENTQVSDETSKQFKVGDVYDIGQTVNGISVFIFLEDGWHYFQNGMTRRYEYSQDDLSIAILNYEGMEDIKYLGNAIDKLQQPTEIETHADYKDQEDWDILDAMVDLQDSKPSDRDKELIEFEKWTSIHYIRIGFDEWMSCCGAEYKRTTQEVINDFRTQQNDN